MMLDILPMILPPPDEMIVCMTRTVAVEPVPRWVLYQFTFGPVSFTADHFK